jgi:hypothetical protein
MPITPQEIAKMKQSIKDSVNNYPDVPAMLAAGRLKKRGAWYEALDKEAHDRIVQYAVAIRVSRSGRSEIKLSKPTKALQAMAKRL